MTEEYLYHYANGRQAVVFKRKNTDEYRFTSDVDLQNSLKERNSPNKLCLSTASNWNYDKVKAAIVAKHHGVLNITRTKNTLTRRRGTVINELEKGW